MILRRCRGKAPEARHNSSPRRKPWEHLAFDPEPCKGGINLYVAPAGAQDQTGALVPTTGVVGYCYVVTP